MQTVESALLQPKPSMPPPAAAEAMPEIPLLAILYGHSGSGKAGFIRSHPELFDRPGVAVHGHAREYALFNRARRFGYELGAVHSNPRVFREILEDPSIDAVVLDGLAMAAEAFGADLFAELAVSGKKTLLLAQSIYEAMVLARMLEQGGVGEFAANIAIFPVSQRGSLAPWLGGIGWRRHG
jgi:hypothetical protein